MQPHTNQENVQHDGNTMSKMDGRRKKLVCIVKVVAVIILLVVAVAVMAYVFLSSKAQGVSCRIHTNISIGQIISTTGSRQGDILEIKCDNNSKLNGSSPVICLSSGMWSASTDCISKDCGRFPLRQNMIAKSGINRTTVGSMISLSCIEGFILSGNKSIICQTNEMWSETPTCKPVDCGPPKNVTNSRQLDIVKTTYNNSFSVECILGYSLIGSKIVTCDKHGQWDTLPVCEIVSCGIPNLPAHASITNLTGTTFQSNMSMKCDEGYLLHGNPVMWCTSSGKWTALPICKPSATDCYDIYKNNTGNKSGVYSVTLWKSKEVIDVYCDMDTYPYGWTVFQKRFNGSVDFYRNFSEYTNGFGNLLGEFWLGLRAIEEMTSQYSSEFRLGVTAADDSHAYEVFQNFSLSKYPKYTLHLGAQTVQQISNDSYGFSQGNGSDFSTFDHDANKARRNCGQLQRGGWWYGDCSRVNLNGEYLTPPGGASIH